MRKVGWLLCSDIFPLSVDHETHFSSPTRLNLFGYGEEDHESDSIIDTLLMTRKSIIILCVEEIM